MDEQVYNQYYDTGGNYHWTGVHSREHILRKGEKMSVSLWAWTEGCDKQVCVGDCDLCSYAEESEEEDD